MAAYQPHPQPGGEPPLDWPHYGIGFVSAVKRGFAKYAQFDGRASRSEFWWWYLFYVVGVGVLAVLTGLLGEATTPDGRSMGAGGIVLGILLVLFLLAILVPSLSLGARRLHDAGLSGLFLLLLLASSFGGGIVLLVLWALPTSPKAVQFGPPGGPEAPVPPYGSSPAAGPYATPLSFGTDPRADGSPREGAPES